MAGGQQARGRVANDDLKDSLEPNYVIPSMPQEKRWILLDEFFYHQGTLSDLNFEEIILVAKERMM